MFDLKKTKMKKLISLLLLAIQLLLLASCANPPENENTTTSDINTSVSETTTTEPYVNTANEQGIIRVDGVVISQYGAPTSRDEIIALNQRIFPGHIKNVESLSRIINDYNTLKSLFESAFSGKYAKYAVNAEDVFDEDLFADNIVIAIMNETYPTTYTPYTWYDCEFTEETNELNITPVRKSVKNMFADGSGMALQSYSLFTVIPRSFFPENYDVTLLKPVMKDYIFLEDSSMPNPWEAGGAITAVIELNLEDNYGDVCEKYSEGKFGPIDFEKVQAEIYGENIEYLKNINLTCPNVIVSKVSRFVYVHFDNRVEFMKYKDYFDALASSEYVKDITIT